MAEPGARRDRMLALVRSTGGSGIAVALCCLLLGVDATLEPGRFALSSDDLGTTIGLFAPLAVAAMASTPAILAGGFDLSIAPLMGVLNAITVRVLIGDQGIASLPVIVPVVLALGLAFGVANGLAHALLRLPAMVATLALYVIYSGLAVLISPEPGGEVPASVTALSGAASILPVLAVALCWLLVRRTTFHEQLMATGGDDRAAYAGGVDVTTVRVVAYGLGGLFCGVAALSLTALLGSADPSVGPTYTMGVVAAVTLGGVGLDGGRGGVLGALAGAGTIFCVQSLLSYLFTTPFAQPIGYGAVLVLALCFNAVVLRRISAAGAVR